VDSEDRHSLIGIQSTYRTKTERGRASVCSRIELTPPRGQLRPLTNSHSKEAPVPNQGRGITLPPFQKKWDFSYQSTGLGDEKFGQVLSLQETQRDLPLPGKPAIRMGILIGVREIFGGRGTAPAGVTQYGTILLI